MILGAGCGARRGGAEAARRRRGGGAEAWDERVGAAVVRQRARSSGARVTLLRPSGAATLTGLISNMMQTASIVSLTPAGGDFMLLTSVISSRLSVLSACTAVVSMASQCLERLVFTAPHSLVLMGS